MEKENLNKNQKESDYTQWKDMPAPKELLTVTWQGVYENVNEATKELHGREPTREEVIDIFDIFAGQSITYDEGDFASIRFCICNYFGCDNY